MQNKLIPLFIMLALLAGVHQAAAQGTAFTYQGQLQNSGSPASGTYNLTFSLFNTTTSGVAIAGPVTNNAVNITNGLFTVLIDFGPGAFTGGTNWLGIGVATNGVTTFTPLAPRQELTPVPNAIYAESAGTLSGPLPASQLTSIGNTNGGAYGNFFVGLSGNATTSGSDNTANGFLALSANTSGSGNTANGYAALYFNASGQENTANGDQALWFNKSGSGNTANGNFALGSNTSGSGNTADGAFALQNNTNDNSLVAIGYQALQNDNAYNQGSFSGNGENTAIGFQTLKSTTTGFANTAIGYQALNQNTGGFENTANGDYALDFNTNGFANTANGYGALYYNTSGSDNTANGAYALNDNTSGSNNVANGFAALFYNTTGYNNTANGYQALEFNTSGYYNTADGYNVLNNNTSGYQNTAMGHDAMKLNQVGYQNVAVGDLALGSSTNDNQLVAIGYHALENDNAYGYGYTDSGNGENTAIGYETLPINTSGEANTAIGYQALSNNTTSSYNTAIGDGALINNTGANNIALGSSAGFNLKSGGNNIYIGNQGGASTESDVIRIGQPGFQTTTYIAGNVGLGGATPQQTLSLNGGMNIDQASQNTGNIGANALTFGSSAGEGILSRRTAGGTDSYGLELWTDYASRLTVLQHGNVGIGTTNPANLFVVGGSASPAYCNGTSWVNGSDRNSKEGFAAINPESVLAKVSALPITEWKYKVEADGTQHLGPMAQDFHAAFGLNGTDDKHIATVDEEGVALAAIQGLNQKLQDELNRQDAENAKLKQQNDSLAERMNELEAAVKQLATQK